MKKETSEKIVKAGKQLMMPEKGIRVVTTTATGAVTVTQMARPAAVPLEVKMALRKDIRRDEDQPRKTFDEGKLQELAESIRAVGIRTPLQVEWVSELKLHEPDLVEKKWTVLDARGPMNAGKTKFRGEEKEAREYLAANPSGFYRLVDGERRWRAAELAGLERVPVMVVDTSSPDWPQQKLAIQVVLNQQHENLSALEEAAAYRKEIEAGRHTAESLYKALGVSRAHLFGRLALNRLPAFAVKALEEGRINTSVAGLVAMVPGEKAQREFLDEVAAVTEGSSWQMRPAYSFRTAQERLEREFCKQLKEAPFDQTDGELVPEAWAGEGVKFEGRPKVSLTPALRAHTGSRTEDDGQGHKKTVWSVWSGEVGSTGGQCLADNLGKPAAEALALVINRGNAGLLRRVKGGACGDCPMRTGNLVEYADALKRPNVCTQPSCYQEKVRAHWLRKAGAAAKKGQTVLEFKEYEKKKGDYMEADRNQWIGNAYSTPRTKFGKRAPATVVVATEEGLLEVFRKSELKQAGLKLGNEGSGSGGESAAEKAAREENKRRKEPREKLARAAVPEVAAYFDKVPEKEAWTLADGMSAELGYYDPGDLADDLVKAAKTVKGKVLSRLFGRDDDNDPVDYEGAWNEDALKEWKKVGVDLLKLETAALEEEKGKAPGANTKDAKDAKVKKGKGKK